jgi:hypothetical protein
MREVLERLVDAALPVELEVVLLGEDDAPVDARLGREAAFDFGEAVGDTVGFRHDQYLDDGERHRFAYLVDRVGPWLPETYGFEGDHDFAGEDFADTYAACAMGYREVDRSLCWFIRRAAIRGRRSL